MTAKITADVASVIEAVKITFVNRPTDRFSSSTSFSTRDSRYGIVPFTYGVCGGFCC